MFCSPVLPRSGHYQGGLSEGLYCGGVGIFHNGQSTSHNLFRGRVFYRNGCVASASFAPHALTLFPP